MTREIKFKAQNKESGKWRTFTLDDLCDGHMTERYIWENWREFTGLKDKNGTEIYEGDLITNHGVTNDMKQRVFVVVWNDEQARFSLHDKAAKMKSGLDHPGGLQQEVIGNIYENKDLLK